MIDTDKWIESTRVSLDELEKEVERLRHEIIRIAGITNGYVGPTKAWAEHITKELLAVIE